MIELMKIEMRVRVVNLNADEQNLWCRCSVPGKIFFANDNRSAVLDLEMLTVKNAALQTSDEDSALASTEHWELGIKDGIFGYRPPARE